MNAKNKEYLLKAIENIDEGIESLKKFNTKTSKLSITRLEKIKESLIQLLNEENRKNS